MNEAEKDMKNSGGQGECYQPRWITPSEICRILHILQKPNSIIPLLFIQNIIFAQTCELYSWPFLSLLNDTALCPGFLSQWFNNLWCQWFNNLQRTALLTSLVHYDRILGQQQLFMVSYVCGLNQSETRKYFEWRIIISIAFTDTEVNNCFSIYHTSWIISWPKRYFKCEKRSKI